MAHGLDSKRLLAQLEAIDEFNAGGYGITLLKGIEVDILEDGDLDMPDRVLAKLEYLNPGGSIKDRPALAMIEAGERSGEKDGQQSQDQDPAERGRVGPRDLPQQRHDRVEPEVAPRGERDGRLDRRLVFDRKVKIPEPE